tara:strand:+ start:374 stop:580 length:207 start_codon:yes stop_codon:yes gene_type:complete
MKFNFTNKSSLLFSVDMSLGDIETEINLLKAITADEKHEQYHTALSQLRKYESLKVDAERSARNQFAS